MDETRESAIWMSVNWHWSSDIGLWIFRSISLNLCPVIMNVAREGGVWVCIHWHWASDVWLRIFLLTKFSIKLQLSPVVVELAGES